MLELDPDANLPKDRLGREPKEHPFVDFGKGRLGFEITQPDETLDLTQMFASDPLDFPEKFTAVYFSTENGNMFKISGNKREDVALLIDAGKSREAGGRLEYTSLFEPEASGLRITIGQSFQMGNVVDTPKVVKISAVNEEDEYPQEVLERISQSRVSSITSDFKKACLPIGFEQK